MTWHALGFLAGLAGALASAFAEEKPGSAMPPVRLIPDKTTFVLGETGRPFRVWGVNYDHDGKEAKGVKGRLLEDYWEDEWETVVADFREMKGLGANVVRVHLQYGKFMSAADKPNEKALERLRRLLALAEETGLYLDLTGLGCYHKADTPAWYDALNEEERWLAQANFWKEIARVSRDSPAVFCYDLMNEPVMDGRTDQGWLAGELGGKHFVQRLTLTPGKRGQIEIAKAWVKKLTEAIRAVDPNHLITVGVIPWAHVWPNAKPIFYSPEVAPMLDFASIHLYPKRGAVDKALTAMAVYDVGKPLVIEETFPLECSLEEMESFLRGGRNRAEGFVSFYWGRTIAECEAAAEDKLANAIVATWLRKFQALAEEMKR